MRAPDAAETEHYWTHGYAVVRQALSGPELTEARRAVAHLLPDQREVRADPSSFPDIRTSGIRTLRFPFAEKCLDDLVAAEDLLGWSADQIGTADLHLGDAMIWGKYAGFSDFDQLLHQDYGNNDLAFPRRDGGFLQLTYILYLTDVTEHDGPTYAVSRTDCPAEAPQFLDDREAFAAMYAAEVPATAQAGDLLVYDTATYHRGSAMRSPDAMRVSVHFQYAASAHRWLGKHDWGIQGGGDAMTGFLTRGTVRQRSLVGFPAPGHAFWTPASLAAVRRRYPDLDLSPYETALLAGAPA